MSTHNFGSAFPYPSYSAYPAASALDHHLLERSDADSGYYPAPEVDFYPRQASDSRSPQHETGGQFTLEQNYPNPYVGETTIPFTLMNTADVRLDVFDLLGRKMAGVIRKGRTPGAQTIKLNLSGLNLPAGDYVYQLQVSNRYGVFCQSRMMTAAE